MRPPAAADDHLGTAATASSVRDSAPSIDVSPSLIAERYAVHGLLGSGGMGRVYRVHDEKLDEVVALKMLRRELVDDPAALERFRQEVKLARRVTSPHVVRTFDLGEHAGEYFLTMEYIEGRSLSVHAGLHDDLWIQRCPLLDPLRTDPRFEQLAATVRTRAETVLAAVRTALADAPAPRRTLGQ